MAKRTSVGAFAGLAMRLLLLDSRELGTSRDSDPFVRCVCRYVGDSARERHIRSFYHVRDSRMALGSTLLQRFWVSQHYAVAFGSVEICRDEPTSRPYYAGGGDGHVYDFNVSHHADFVLLGAAPGRIGVDLSGGDAQLGLDGSLESLDDFEMVFAPKEWALLRSEQLTAGQRLAYFYQLWALKESYVKALGVGLAVELADVDIKVSRFVDSHGLNSLTVGAATICHGGRLREDVVCSLFQPVPGLYGAVTTIGVPLAEHAAAMLETIQLRDIELQSA